MLFSFSFLWLTLQFLAVSQCEYPFQTSRHLSSKFTPLFHLNSEQQMYALLHSRESTTSSKRRKGNSSDARTKLGTTTNSLRPALVPAPAPATHTHNTTLHHHPTAPTDQMSSLANRIYIPTFMIRTLDLLYRLIYRLHRKKDRVRLLGCGQR